MSGKEELEAMKVLAKSRFPDDESIIGLIETNDEMVDYLKQKRELEEGETEPQNGAEAPKTLGVVKHVHELLTKKPKEDQINDDDSDIEGGTDLSSTGGQIWLKTEGGKPQTWESHEQMLDDLFKLEMLSKIESTKAKPNAEIIERGTKATEMIERLYKSGMQSGRLSRAGKDLMRGRFEFEEPEWFRQLRNPKGRKKAKEKPYLVESL